MTSMPAGDVAALADELAGELNAATFVRHGDDDEACDFIYVLCMGRSAVRRRGARSRRAARPPSGQSDRARRRAVPAPGDQPARTRRGRAAGRDRARARGRRLRRPRATARRRVRRAAAGADAEARGDPAGVRPAARRLRRDRACAAGLFRGPWRDRFGGEPAIANYLFYAQPTTMVATTWLTASP